MDDLELETLLIRSAPTRTLAKKRRVRCVPMKAVRRRQLLHELLVRPSEAPPIDVENISQALLAETRHLVTVGCGKHVRSSRQG